MQLRQIAFLLVPQVLMAEGLSKKDQKMCETILEECINKADRKDLPEKKSFRYFLTMLGALFLLSECGKPSERLRYKNLLGLLFFNHDSDFRDPYFKEAMKIFTGIGGYKALLRAAYSAWSIKENDLAKELFEEFKASKKGKLSKTEEGMCKILNRMEKV